MKYLKLTDSLDPRNPSDGNPYVFYNREKNKVWIYFGTNWILETGFWDMSKVWDSNGRWNY